MNMHERDTITKSITISKSNSEILIISKIPGKSDAFNLPFLQHFLSLQARPASTKTHTPT